MERRIVAEQPIPVLFLVLACDRNLAWNKSASYFIRLIIEFKFLPNVKYSPFERFYLVKPIRNLIGEFMIDFINGNLVLVVKINQLKIWQFAGRVLHASILLKVL